MRLTQSLRLGLLALLAVAAPLSERGSIAAPGRGPDASVRPTAAPDSAEFTSAPSGSGRGGAARNSA